MRKFRLAAAAVALVAVQLLPLFSMRTASAATATFGNTTIGNTTSSPGAGYKFGSVYPLSQSGTAVSFSWYTKGGASAQKMTPVVYSADSSGNPTTLVAKGAEVTVAANKAAGWVTSTLPAVALASGNYLLGLMSGPTGSQVLNYYTPTTNGAFWNANTYGSPTSSWGQINRENSRYSFYVTYNTTNSPPPAPVNTALPVVSGSTVAGQTLSTTTGSWTNNPTGYAYQWQRCTSAGANCANIANATGASYALGNADAGTTVRANVTASNGGGSATASSAVTAVITAPPASTTVGNTAVGTVANNPGAGYKFGSIFTASSPGNSVDFKFYARGGSASQKFIPVVYSVNASNQPANLLAQGSEVTIAANQAAGWVTSTLSGLQITSGTKYFLGLLSGPNDTGAFIYAQNQANAGFWNANAYPTPSSSWGQINPENNNWGFYLDITPPVPTAPANTALPVVTGTAVVGSTLTATAGSWTGTAPITYTYQWQRCDSTGANCADIANATSSTYMLTVADVASRMRVNVKATNSVGNATASSAVTAVVSALSLPHPRLNLMPLGDSITEGWIHVPGAYRIQLWQDLVQRDHDNIDFVGSLSDGPDSLGDRDHEGHSGYRIDEMRAGIDGWIAQNRPDIVLLHIGTNDVLQNYDLANAPARLKDLVDRIYADAPGVKIVLASIIPRPGLDDQVNAFNAQIPGIVSAEQAAGKPIQYVNMNAVLTGADLDESATHPMLDGYNKMAEAWYPTVKQLYDNW